MDIHANWIEIKKHFNRSFRSNFYVSIASVDATNNPTVTPIGSLFLNNDQTGFYFEKYPSKLPQNSMVDKQICVLAVNSNIFFWLLALFNGEFKKNPAIKLYGKLGQRRKATVSEIQRMNLRMRPTKWLKGNKYLWSEMDMVRDITFISAEKINLGKMTANT